MNHGWKNVDLWMGLSVAAMLVAVALMVTTPLAAKKRPPAEAGNNLSFPVIFPEGVINTLPAPPAAHDPPIGEYLQGAWWWQWGTNGTDPEVTPASCKPDPQNTDFCDDGNELTYDESLVPGVPPAENPLPLAKAYLQKDPNNWWRADTVAQTYDRDTGEILTEIPPQPEPVIVDRIDWGDNLESVDWYTRSQVRTEVVLFKDIVGLKTYEMRHVDGWGIDEVHGMATDTNGNCFEPPDNMATVYSECARLTIQKLLVDREDPALANLVWAPESGQWVNEALVNEPIFNMAVHEAADGPGYYNAEINVKGRVIYGYTWNVRKLSEGAGDYRITFSFDATCGDATIPLNTVFDKDLTSILLPVEEEAAVEPLAAIEGETEGGGVARLVYSNDPFYYLTYIDVRILERGGGGGGKP